MGFDYERLKKQLKIVYATEYSDIIKPNFQMEDVYSVIEYFMKLYAVVMDEPHPPLSTRTVNKIVAELGCIMVPVNELPFYDPEQKYTDGCGVYFPTTEDCKNMINEYFVQNFKTECDYRINHFLSKWVQFYLYQKVQNAEV